MVERSPYLGEGGELEQVGLDLAEAVLEVPGWLVVAGGRRTVSVSQMRVYLRRG